jgi:hypothetical protein
LPGAWAGPEREVDSVGKNVLRGPPGANDKGPSKCRQTRDPQTRGQIPKRPQHQLPADWDTRSTRSHLGERPEHEIPDFCSRRGGPGGGPRSGPDFPERGWGSRGLGFESVPGGVPTGSTGGGRGRPKERRLRRAKRRLKRPARIQCGGHCRALALLLRRSRQSPCSGWMCDGSYCTSAVAPQVPCGGIWAFGDLATGAHLSWRSFWCPAKLRSPLSPICDSQSTDRWQEPVHQAPCVTAAWGDLGAKLWTLAVSHRHHRLRRSPPHMIAPAAATLNGGWIPSNTKFTTTWM